MKTKKHCTQNNGDCATCSLVNYGRDCQNKKLYTCKNCGTLFSLDTDFSIFFEGEPDPQVCSDECGAALRRKKMENDDTPPEWRHNPRIIFPQ